MNEIRLEMLKAESQTMDISKEIELLKRHINITELNRKIVTSLIQSIHVSEPEIIDKEKRYDVEIRYKFQNPLSTKKEDTLSAK